MEGQSRESSSSSVGSASPAAASVLEDLPVKQLKDLLKQNGVDPSGSVEKSDLIELAIKHNLQGKAEFYSIHKNHLGEEKSPYLLQHKDNPVHWFSYGPKAFEIAKKEDKPLLISIGYATCHWCHVMEHQSFEDDTVAAALNQDFISIKVDREEMPDVDTIYMNAAQSIGVSGGWPLNVFVTPDLKPFFAGTYFPKRSFLNVLARLSEGWKNEREKILEAGEVLFENLNENATRLYGKGEVPLDHSVLQKFYDHCRARYESDYGGFNSAPKFPPSVQLQVLLRLYRRTKDVQALKMVEGTLQGMVKGGMWDHLGGGFARYSTDERWLIPHFEKMLYDNALLLGVYLEAYQVTRDPLYASVARETAEYVLAVMHSPEGGFYSAEDADSEGVEGKFYVWTKKEIFSLLPVEEAERFCEVYGVTDEGNFEHGTTNLNLLDQERIDWRVKDDPVIKSASKKLYEIREKRIHPLKDDKQLTCWNGLMIKSMALAARVLHDDRYLQAAEKAASFFKEKMYHESTGTLLRRYRDGEAKFEGTLDDYAYMIAGLIQLYQTDFDQQWLQWAVRLQETQDKLFWDAQNGGYFFTPELSTVNVIVRTKDYFDGATPSGNLVSILNLLQLEHLTYDENKGYKATAEKVFKSVGKILGEHPEGFVSALVALDYYTDAAKQVAIILPEGGDPRGESAKEFLEIVSSNFLPNLVVACGAEGSSVGLLRSKVAVGGKPTAYLCEGTLCTAPTTDPVELSQKLLESIKDWTLD